MTRPLMLRRLINEPLESKRLLSADGNLVGDCEHVESEFVESEHEHEQEHESNSDDGDHSSSDDVGHDEMELRARLKSDSAAHGEAEYEAETEHGKTEQEFEVEIEDAEPGSVHDVSIDGTSVGQLSVGDGGKGRLSLSSHPEDGRASPAG